MEDLTILYYTSNREKPAFEERVREVWMAACGDLPIVSVSQRSMDVGHNICVGDVRVSGFNMFRQCQIGLREVKTKFVISVEADCLYPPDYFTFVPPLDDVFYRNDNTYLIGQHRKYYWRKPEGGTWAQVVGTQHYLNRLNALFEGAPEWSAEELNFPKERWRINDVPDVVIYYSSPTPCVTIKASGGMRHYSHSDRVPIYTLPYWGTAAVLRERLQP